MKRMFARFILSATQTNCTICRINNVDFQPIVYRLLLSAGKQVKPVFCPRKPNFVRPAGLIWKPQFVFTRG